MNTTWHKMDVADYAAFEQAQGEEVLFSGGIYWRKVRPFFRRPLLSFEKIAPGAVRLPRQSLLASWQCAVPDGAPANSQIMLRIYTNLQTYSLGSLHLRRQRQVKQAARQLTIHPMAGPCEFSDGAFPVYLGFYSRTRYSFNASRRTRSGFALWAEQLYQFPGNLVLGAYQGTSLCGVSVSHLVGDVLLYSTFFCDDQGLHLHAADLMLHTVRTMAASRTDVRQICSGLYRGGDSLDKFHMMRGCLVAGMPAWLHLAPGSALLLRLCLRRQYARLLGIAVADPGANAPSEDKEPISRS